MIEQISDAAGRSVSRETFRALEQFTALLTEENQRQNLVAKSTIAGVWERHILDGAQLLRFTPPGLTWCDIGSGPGLPGLVIAIIAGDPITLIEPRRRRVEFLNDCVEKLGLCNVTTILGKAEQCSGSFDVITARAVASLPNLFKLAAHLAHSGTKWVIPKGVKAKSELDDARRSWQGSFELVPSLTGPEASIVIAEGLQPRGKR